MSIKIIYGYDLTDIKNVLNIDNYFELQDMIKFYIERDKLGTVTDSNGIDMNFIIGNIVKIFPSSVTSLLNIDEEVDIDEIEEKLEQLKDCIKNDNTIEYDTNIIVDWINNNINSNNKNVYILADE